MQRVSLEESQKVVLKDTVKRFEKDLYKVNSYLGRTDDFGSSIVSLFQNVFVVEELLNENVSLKENFQKDVHDKKLISLFKDFSFKMNKLKQDIEALDSAVKKTDEFLESFRNYRTYSFDSLKEAGAFIEKTVNLLSLTDLKFIPEFVGTINLGEFANSLGLERTTNELILKNDIIPALFELLEQKNTNRPFRIVSEHVKFIFKGPSEVIVEGKTEQIKNLDKSCNEMSCFFTEQ